MVTNKFSAGMGTTPDMWVQVGEVLEGKRLPVAVNAAIYALCDGSAVIVPRDVAAGYDQLCIGVAP